MEKAPRRCLRKIRRNLELLRRQFSPVETRWSWEKPTDEQIMEATKRFMTAFFKARGFLPDKPTASMEEIRKALQELELMRAFPEASWVKTMLTEIEDLIGKHNIELAITKMQQLFAMMVKAAFPPPTYIV